MFATEPFLGVRPATTYTFFIIASPVGAYYAEGLGPVRIRIEDQYVRAAPGGLGAVKAAANYAASLMAAEEAKKDGFAQVLWTDAIEHAALEEVGTMNLFVRIGEEFATPELSRHHPGRRHPRERRSPFCAAGATRSTSAASWSRSCCARSASGALREVFGTGTAAVISPVGELGWKGQQFVVGDGRPGEVSQKLFTAITDIQYGRATDPDGWTTLVE